MPLLMRTITMRRFTGLYRVRRFPVACHRLHGRLESIPRNVDMAGTSDDDRRGYIKKRSRSWEGFVR